MTYQICPDCWGVIQPKPEERDRCTCQKEIEMKALVRDFEDLQEDVLGFLQYRVRTQYKEYFVDAFTRNGNYIKCKAGRLTEDAAREWISGCIHQLTTAGGIKNLHSH